VSFYYCFSYLTSIYSEDSGRKGKVTWGKLAKNPQSLIAPRFLLSPKLEDPTRMPLSSLSVYWSHWEFKGRRGDPFSFLDAGRNQDMVIGSDDQGDEDAAPYFAIDDGILSPLLCCGTSSNRTRCLQALVTGTSEENRAFRTTVKLVDTLEVSYIEYSIYTISHRILG
jgi:hypothetical protein